MKLLNEHIIYLKDNPGGYWFKRKLYGFGWTPATKQGWLVLGAYLILILGFVIYSTPIVSEEETVTKIVLPIAVGTLLFLTIMWRTGEPLKWQWGKKEDQ